MSGTAESEILSYLQINGQVVCHTLMDLNRRYETSEKETKAFITYNKSNSECMSIFLG